MTMRTLGALVALFGVFSLAPGCVDDRRTSPGTDGGSTVDGGGTLPPIPPVPPGGVSVTIDNSSWIGEEGLPLGLLAVAVRVASAADGTPAPLVYTSFSLETDIGAVIAADRSSRDSCAEGISVAPGAALPCVVNFEVPPGQTPVLLRYVADASRMAMAPISTCSAASPTGLCNPGQVCRSGSCQTQCSSAAPEGFCPGADQRCESGRCRGPCSATDPTGFCAEGACVDGECSTSCIPLSLGEPGCMSCAFESSADCSLTSAACVNEEECLNCVLVTGSTCGCEMACEGCFEEVVTGVGCIRAECPLCR